MNKKGQSLITFVLILPIIVLFVAFFIDSGVNIMNKVKMEGIIKSNMQIALDKNIYDEEKIKSAIYANDKDLLVDIDISNNMINIKASSKKKSLFGRIFDTEWLNIKTSYCANFHDKKIKKEC